MRLIGCVSTFNEGRLLRECLRSLLEATEFVILYEGPFGEMRDDPQMPTDLSHPDIQTAIKKQRLIIKYGNWETQARKLTELTHHVQRFGKDSEPVWAMHLDGDEVLIWPQFLRDIVERFTEAKPDDRYMNIKLVELDGTVGGTQTHLIRADLIDQYFVSGSQILFKGDSFPVSLHNPEGDRFPIQGEPHILHRSALRPEGRDNPELRAHLSQEADWFELAAAMQGLKGVKPGD